MSSRKARSLQEMLKGIREIINTTIIPLPDDDINA
jgi:hypothetical protein